MAFGSHDMASEDGWVFIKYLAQFVRTHEKALANYVQQRQKRVRQAQGSLSAAAGARERTAGSTSGTISMAALASALSLEVFGLGTHNAKPARLTLTPHHLFYLLSRFEELGVDVGQMNIRLENLTADASPANYVSFLSQPQKARGRSDRDSIHSVSSVRSVLSSVWSGIGFSGSNQGKSDKALAQQESDLKYLYSSFTKIPSLRLAPDHHARLIRGYEEFPFDSAVPLVAFKNLSMLEIHDLDFRLFYGWDRLADQLRSLTIKRGHLEDLTDLLVHVVLDDMDKRRRRSSKLTSPSTPAWPATPSQRHIELSRTISAPDSPLASESAIATSRSPRNSAYLRGDVEIAPARSDRRRRDTRDKSSSPVRGSTGRPGSSYRNLRTGGERMKRGGSGSSQSSEHSLHSRSRSRSSSNLLAMGILQPTKWQLLQHLCIADNGITSLTVSSLAPLANTLQSLDISSNLFTEIPDCLAILTSLRSLDLSNCMINSLHSLSRNPLPAITALNLRLNRLSSIAGVERLLSLERFDIRQNRLTDPTELARLTGVPEIRDIWVDGNPFVRSHGAYRVTIFNLFRAVPGRTADICIDSHGPGYAERRHLRERAPESSAPPLVRTPSVDFDTAVAAVEVRKANALENTPTCQSLGARPSPHTVQSEVGVAGSQRKRSAKRRIVDLSVEERPNLLSSSLDQAESENSTAFRIVQTTERKTITAGPPLESQPSVSVPLQSRSVNGDQAPVEATMLLPPSSSSIATAIKKSVQHSNAQLNPPVSTPTAAPQGSAAPLSSAATAISSTAVLESSVLSKARDSAVRDLEQSNLSGDAYRAKIQALKEEFGTSWLRVLGDQEMEQTQAHHPHAAREAHRSQTPLGSTVNVRLSPEVGAIRAGGTSIVSGARTLG